MGVRVGIKVQEEEVKGMEGTIVRLREERWRIMEIYVRENLDRKLGWLREKVEREEEGTRVLIGDFNARTGEEGGIIKKGEWEKDWRGRRSKDKKVNAEGRVLVKWVEEVGWTIFNGSVKGDEKGDWTYTGGRGKSVIL